MNISQEDAIRIKNLYLSKRYGAQNCWLNFPTTSTRVGNLEVSIVYENTQARVQLPGNQAALGRLRSARSDENIRQNGKLVLGIPFHLFCKKTAVKTQPWTCNRNSVKIHKC